MRIPARTVPIAAIAAAAISSIGLAALPAAPAAATPAAPLGPSTPAVPTPSFALDGTWTGSGVDSGGATVVTWILAQSGASVSGTMTTRAVDPADGSCNSCHRNKV